MHLYLWHIETRGPRGPWVAHLRIRSKVTVEPIIDKRAQRALGRSPEEKVKGHSGFNIREPQGHNLNNFGRGPFDDVIY